MSLILSEDQRLLQDVARDFIQAKSPVSLLRQVRDDNIECGYSQELWQGMIEMGWPGTMLPESVGGFDFGLSGLGTVLLECGRTLSASPLLITAGLCAPLLLRAADEAQRQRLLPKLAGGESTFALALDEGRCHDPASVGLKANKVDGTWQLSGAKHCIVDGQAADYLLVVGRSGGEPGTTEGLSLFLVDPQATGLSVTPLGLIDSRNAADLEFDNVPAELIGSESQLFSALDFALDCGRIMLASEMLGVALEAFDRTVAYLKEREQFGVKIGSFQALQHRAGMIFTELELSRSLLIDAWQKGDVALRDNTAENCHEFAVASSAAKSNINESGMLAVNEAVQMHGGIGMTDELEIGFFLKHMQVCAMQLGDVVFHRSRYADLSGF